MKVLLKESGTSKFVGRPSQWTEQMENARVFGGLTDALFYCYQHDLKNIEILGESDDNHVDFKMALPEI